MCGKRLRFCSSCVIEHDSISHIKIHIHVALHVYTILHCVCSLLYMSCRPVEKTFVITVTSHVTHNIRQNCELSLKIPN